MAAALPIWNRVEVPPMGLGPSTGGFMRDAIDATRNTTLLMFTVL